MKKIGFIFPGQGSQYVGMGKELYDNFEEAKYIFDEVSEKLNRDIKKLCFSTEFEELSLTENSQVAIVTTSIAALEVLRTYGVQWDIVAGFSLGEYSALICAGAMNIFDGIDIVCKRGAFMKEASEIKKGKMAAIIGLSEDRIKEICKECSHRGVIAIANYNCPSQIVISGEIEALNKAVELCIINGAKKVIELKVSGAFHTSLLNEASEKLYKELEKSDIENISGKFIPNLTGELLEKDCDIREILKSQIKSPVQWEKTIRNMLEDGIEVFIEIGPGKTLSNFIKRINRGAKVLNVEDMESLKNTLRELQIEF